MERWLLGLLLICVCLLGPGCSLLPQRLDRPQLYNPFPQLHKIAVVPFFNQSNHPNINGAEVANAYRHQLQQIRGFEVVPVGVVDQFLKQNPIAINSVPDFQLLARQLGVDAVVVGSITDFDPYYPPKMGLAVRWYAANPHLHPIPPGYGLPWGTADEEYIPDDLRYEAEFALATEQMKTQTPVAASDLTAPMMPLPGIRQAGYEGAADDFANGESAHGGSPSDPTEALSAAAFGRVPPRPDLNLSARHLPAPASGVTTLPPDWPDPNGFVPDAPAAVRPIGVPQNAAVMELIKQFDGADSDFTARLESYYTFRDDARFGGWQSYLERKDDFINFCCYLHISELLSGRGGAGDTRTVYRWPFGK